MTNNRRGPCTRLGAVAQSLYIANRKSDADYAAKSFGSTAFLDTFFTNVSSSMTQDGIVDYPSLRDMLKTDYAKEEMCRTLLDSSLDVHQQKQIEMDSGCDKSMISGMDMVFKGMIRVANAIQFSIQQLEDETDDERRVSGTIPKS